MTQFIVVTGDVNYLEPPPGISALPVEQERLSILAELFPGHTGPCARVIETQTGEADALLDALYDDPERGLGAALMVWLEHLDTLGCGIAMWYSDDSAKLPRYRRWDEFAQAVRREAASHPPEVYAVYWPMRSDP